MLRIECYPVLDGLLVHMAGFDHSETPHHRALSPATVWRTIPTPTVESLGLEEALRDVIVDVVTEYPGLLSYALK